MLYKNHELNKYPEIILSDCLIVNVQKMEDTVIMQFSEYGFIKKSDMDSKYYRTGSSQIIIEGCDIDEIEIKEVRNCQLQNADYCELIHDIRMEDFMRNVNQSNWKLEIVEEFYSVGGAIYRARVRACEDSFWCYIKFRFKNIIYLWNDIKYDYLVN